MNIHCIGIGGIGVSALARYYLAKGHMVSGSDLAASEITRALQSKGARISIGSHQASNIKQGTDLVIFSPAVTPTNPERKEASRRKIQQQSYPEALGELTKNYFTIAVAGTHGKSTTTAMIGLLLTKAGLDPTVIVGTKVKEFDPPAGGSNCRVGKSNYLVLEADEHFASFLHYRPQIAVLTSVEADHLDYYKTLGNLLKTFRKFISAVPKNGIIIGNREDKNIARIVQGKKRVAWFSLKTNQAKKLKNMLKVPGEHNVANALAALAVARSLNIPDRASMAALAAFQGSWRRFEIFSLAKPKSYTLVSDYGHHPTEIRVTMQATRDKWPKKKIWLVFQPHQYQRTFYLWQEFIATLSRLPVDKIILADIYDVAGREDAAIKRKVSAKKLALLLQKKGAPVLHIPDLAAIQSYLQKNIRGGEVIVMMGAGDIYEKLTLHLTPKNGKGKIQS